MTVDIEALWKENTEYFLRACIVRYYIRHIIRVTFFMIIKTFLLALSVSELVLIKVTEKERGVSYSEEKCLFNFSS